MKKKTKDPQRKKSNLEAARLIDRASAFILLAQVDEGNVRLFSCGHANAEAVMVTMTEVLLGLAKKTGKLPMVFADPGEAVQEGVAVKPELILPSLEPEPFSPKKD